MDDWGRTSNQDWYGIKNSSKAESPGGRLTWGDATEPEYKGMTWTSRLPQTRTLQCHPDRKTTICDRRVKTSLEMWKPPKYDPWKQLHVSWRLGQKEVRKAQSQKAIGDRENKQCPSSPKPLHRKRIEAISCLDTDEAWCAYWKAWTPTGITNSLLNWIDNWMIGGHHKLEEDQQARRS